MSRLLGIQRLLRGVVSVEGPGGTPLQCCNKRLLGQGETGGIKT